jgi:hypothetical protein
MPDQRVYVVVGVLPHMAGSLPHVDSIYTTKGAAEKRNQEIEVTDAGMHTPDGIIPYMDSFVQGPVLVESRFHRMHGVFEPNPRKYGWVIVRDFVTDGESVGVLSAGSPFTEKEIRSKGELHRILDDDGELYYHVKILGDYTGFEPLDQFAGPNAGATEVQYTSRDGEWRPL